MRIIMIIVDLYVYELTGLKILRIKNKGKLMSRSK